MPGSRLPTKNSSSVIASSTCRGHASKKASSAAADMPRCSRAALSVSTGIEPDSVVSMAAKNARTVSPEWT